MARSNDLLRGIAIGIVGTLVGICTIGIAVVPDEKAERIGEIEPVFAAAPVQAPTPAIVSGAAETKAGEQQEPDPIDPEALARRSCQSQWADDYQMQKYCLDENRTAANALGEVQRAAAAGSTENQILGRCIREWVLDRPEKADFTMAKYCYDEQLEAYRSLR